MFLRKPLTKVLYLLKGNAVKEFLLWLKKKSSKNCSSFKSELLLRFNISTWQTDLELPKTIGQDAVLNFQLGPDRGISNLGWLYFGKETLNTFCFCNVAYYFLERLLRGSPSQDGEPLVLLQGISYSKEGKIILLQ